MNIQLRTKELRKKRGISQYKLAQGLGISPQTLSYYEDKKVAKFSKINFEKAAEILGVEKEELYTITYTHDATKQTRGKNS